MADVDLHTECLREIGYRESVAREAAETWPGRWTYDGRHNWLKDQTGYPVSSAGPALGAYMVTQQPGDALARYAIEREVLDRHDHWQQFPDEPNSRWCRSCESHFKGWCPEVLAVAHRLGIAV